MSKKSEPVITIPADELPNGWSIASIADLVGSDGVFVDGDWVESKDQDPNGDVRLIQLADVGDGFYRDKSSRFLTQQKAVELNCTFLDRGDALIARMPDPLGRVCIFPGDSKKAVTVVDVAVVRSGNDSFSHRWLMHFVNAPAFRSAVASLQSGSTRKRISRKNLARIMLPVPPREQQDEIVAEIEKQFSLLDEAVANLKRVKANLKRYKATVLKAAVEGKLTEEWRKAHLPAPTSRPGKFYTYAILCEDDSIYIGHTEDIARRWKEHRAGTGAEWTKEHKPVRIVHYEEFDTREEAADREKWLKTGYGRKWIKRELAAGRTRQAGDVEPASKLLERILVERRAKWEEAELAKMEAKGKAPKNDKWKARYKEPLGPDGSDLPELPSGWGWVLLDSLIIQGPQNGLYLPKTKYGSGHPILRIDDYQQDWIRPVAELHRVQAKAEDLVNYKLRSGNLVINRVNSPSHLGKVAIWQSNTDMPVFESNMMRAEVSSFVTPIYVASYLRSLQGRARLTKHAKWAVNQASINQKDVCGTPVPLPPLAEQERIVTEVDSHLSLIRETENQVETNLKRAERLRSAVLSRAFAGNMSTETQCGAKVPRVKSA